MNDKNNSDSTVYRWLAQAAGSGIPEIEVAARTMMDYYEGAESSAPAAPACRWPLCQSEEYQAALAAQIHRDLYSGEPPP